MSGKMIFIITCAWLLSILVPLTIWFCDRMKKQGQIGFLFFMIYKLHEDNRLPIGNFEEIVKEIDGGLHDIITFGFWVTWFKEFFMKDRKHIQNHFFSQQQIEQFSDRYVKVFDGVNNDY